MPVIRCTQDGKAGWKVENANKCFTGPDARERAKRQLIAIKTNQSKGQEDNESDNNNSM